MNQHIMYKFRLYIADGVQNSAQAVSNLTALCQAHLPDRHEIEVVDVFREPKRALADRILMTPTLVKVEPSPIRRVMAHSVRRNRYCRLWGWRPSPHEFGATSRS